MCNKKPLTPNMILDETWFSDPVTCEELKLWYMLSKTLAEEAAWKFAKENGIDMITMNPGLVIGPLLQPTTTFSVEMILKLLKGTYFSYDGYYRFVDIRDVANAHIKAFVTPSASGRYLLVGRMVCHSETRKILRELYPALFATQKLEDDKPSGPIYQVSQEKARSLGIAFIPLEVSLKDMIESLKEKGFLSF